MPRNRSNSGWSRRLLAGFGTLILCVACTSPQTVVRWNKQGATEAELDAAREACKNEPGANEVQTGRDRVDGELRANAFVRCMEARGFSWTTEPKPAL